jgi:hypothetical protein
VRPSAEESLPVALFVGEVDHLDVDGQAQPGLLDRAQTFQPGQHAHRAVKAPAVRHAVQMRADEERFGVWIEGRQIHAAEVPGVVVAHTESGLFDAGGEPGAGFQVFVGERGRLTPGYGRADP